MAVVYTVYWMALFSITLNERISRARHWSTFNISETLQERQLQWTMNRNRIEWCHFKWPRVTPDLHCVPESMWPCLRRQIELELSVYKNCGTFTTKTIGHRQVFLFSHLTYFVQLLYVGKLCRLNISKIKQNHENVTRKCDSDQESIDQKGMVHECSWVNFPARVGNLEAITVCWRESARWVQCLTNMQQQTAVDA